MQQCWLNGALKPVETPIIHVTDQGFTSGDGIFEPVALKEGKPFALRRHLEFFKKSAKNLFVQSEFIDKVPWADVFLDLYKANGSPPDCVVKIIATTGPSEPGVQRLQKNLNVCVVLERIVFVPSEIKLEIAPWPKNERGALSGIRTLSLAENVKALEIAQKSGATDSLFLNTKGNVCETANGSIFWVKGKKVFTPGMLSGCTSNVMRNLIIELIRTQATELEECNLPEKALLKADEAFLVTDTFGVQWVSRAADMRWNSDANQMTVKVSQALKDLSARSSNP
jgi:branched-chain amino acid aminotransferase